jgi:hypothetical protein
MPLRQQKDHAGLMSTVDNFFLAIMATHSCNTTSLTQSKPTIQQDADVMPLVTQEVRTAGNNKHHFVGTPIHTKYAVDWLAATALLLTGMSLPSSCKPS